jgi:vacuole morphology and inheritance protein 14
MSCVLLMLAVCFCAVVDACSGDRELLQKRGSFVIRQLSALLTSEKILRSIAGTITLANNIHSHSAILLKEEDLAFASLMVQYLSVILMTSPELAELRSRLKNMATKEDCELFVVLYRFECSQLWH